MTEEKDTRPLVLIAILNTGTIRAETAQRAIQMLHDPRYRVMLVLSNNWVAASNRGKVIQRAKALEELPDWILMLDSDVDPYKNVLDLIEEDKDVIGFLCPIWRIGTRPQSPVTSNIWIKDEEGMFTERVIDIDKDPPLIKVAAVGTSAFLISRRVYEHPDMLGAFADRFDEEGVLLSTEDIGFCQRAIEAGFEVWACLSHPCGHWKRVDINAVHMALQYWQGVVKDWRGYYQKKADRVKKLEQLLDAAGVEYAVDNGGRGPPQEELERQAEAGVGEGS